MNILFTHTFYIKCLGQTLTAYVSVDNSYWMSINNVYYGAGAGWGSADAYSVSTAGEACGKN